MYRNQFQKVYFPHSVVSCTLPDVIYVEPRFVFPFLEESMCQNLSNAWNKIHFETSAPACSYSPLLPIGKEPPSSSAWSLPLFLPRFVSPQFIAWVPGVFVEGLCRSWLRDFQVTVAYQLKMTEEALLSWLSRRVSFLAKAKSSYRMAFTC